MRVVWIFDWVASNSGSFAFELEGGFGVLLAAGVVGVSGGIGCQLCGDDVLKERAVRAIWARVRL